MSIQKAFGIKQNFGKLELGCWDFSDFVLPITY